MDIIIQNGVIKQMESVRIHDIMNEEGLLKKDFKNYIKGVPGPYYDLAHSHICIPRKFHMIPNFIGPQDKTKIKLIKNEEFNKKTSYCIICHQELKPNVSFSAKRKQFYEENIYSRKPEPICELEQQFKKMKVKSEISQNSPDLDSCMMSLSINNKTILNWIRMFQKQRKIKINDYVLKKEYDTFKYNQQKILNKYYQIVYKLTKEPILYPISNKETKLMYPWELTNYQKFRLTNMNYKSSVIFLQRPSYQITTNYVMIE